MNKFTYSLETDEEEEIGDQMRSIQTVDLVHVRARDGRRALHEASVNEFKIIYALSVSG